VTHLVVHDNKLAEVRAGRVFNQGMRNINLNRVRFILKVIRDLYDDTCAVNRAALPLPVRVGCVGVKRSLLYLFRLLLTTMGVDPMTTSI